MTEVAVTEVLGELLSPSQVITYMITGSAKWYFRYLIGLISGFAPKKTTWKTPPFGNNC